MHDGVAAVHHVVEALRVLHGGAVLHVELDPVLDGGLHLAAVVLGDAHHVGGQVEAMHVHTIPAQCLLWAGDSYCIKFFKPVAKRKVGHYLKSNGIELALRSNCVTCHVDLESHGMIADLRAMRKAEPPAPQPKSRTFMPGLRSSWATNSLVVDSPPTLTKVRPKISS